MSAQIAILLGASEYPGLPTLAGTLSAPYLGAAAKLEEYLAQELGPAGLKSFFDSTAVPSVQLAAAREFVQSHGDAQRLIIAYIGHGDSFETPSKDFFLACRSTERAPGREFTKEMIVTFLMEVCNHLQVFFIVDCCFAATVVDWVLPLDRSTKGISVLAACSRTRRATAPQGVESRNTQFCGLLLDVLREGVSERGERLSLSELRAAIAARGVQAFGPGFAPPEQQSVNQGHAVAGEIALFRNRAWRGLTEGMSEPPPRRPTGSQGTATDAAAPSSQSGPVQSDPIPADADLIAAAVAFYAQHRQQPQSQLTPRRAALVKDAFKALAPRADGIYLSSAVRTKLMTDGQLDGEIASIVGRGALQPHQGAVTRLYAIPPRKLISSASDEQIFLCDVVSNRDHLLKEDDSVVRAVTVTPKTQWVFAALHTDHIRGYRIGHKPSADSDPSHYREEIVIPPPGPPKAAPKVTSYQYFKQLLFMPIGGEPAVPQRRAMITSLNAIAEDQLVCGYEDGSLRICTWHQRSQGDEPDRRKWISAEYTDLRAGSSEADSQWNAVTASVRLDENLLVVGYYNGTLEIWQLTLKELRYSVKKEMVDKSQGRQITSLTRVVSLAKRTEAARELNFISRELDFVVGFNNGPLEEGTLECYRVERDYRRKPPEYLQALWAQGQPSAVMDCVATEDRRWLVSLGADGPRLWSCDTGAMMQCSLQLPALKLHSIAVVCDVLCAGADDGAIYRWPLQILGHPPKGPEAPATVSGSIRRSIGVVHEENGAKLIFRDLGTGAKRKNAPILIPDARIYDIESPHGSELVVLSTASGETILVDPIGAQIITKVKLPDDTTVLQMSRNTPNSGVSNNSASRVAVLIDGIASESDSELIRSLVAQIDQAALPVTLKTNQRVARSARDARDVEVEEMLTRARVIIMLLGVDYLNRVSEEQRRLIEKRHRDHEIDVLLVKYQERFTPTTQGGWPWLNRQHSDELDLSKVAWELWVESIMKKLYRLLQLILEERDAPAS